MKTVQTAEAYSHVIAKTAAMVADRSVEHLAAKHGLHVLDVTWEDTARFDSSAVGPNISDMTIQIQHQPPGTDRFGLTCMPVIRHPKPISAAIFPSTSSTCWSATRKAGRSRRSPSASCWAT